MKTIEVISFRKLSDTSIYLFTAVVITLFLFYIDEGYYSFQWMTSLGAWIIFAIYTSFFLGTQLGVNALLSRIVSFKIRRTLSVILGIFFAMFFLVVIFFKA
jgi:hypothetical protein